MRETVLDMIFEDFLEASEAPSKHHPVQLFLAFSLLALPLALLWLQLSSHGIDTYSSGMGR